MEEEIGGSINISANTNDLQNAINNSLNSQLSSSSLINANTITGSIGSGYGGYGYGSTITSTFYDDCSIRISDSLYNKEKIKEILDDVMNFCDNYCVLKCEDICDGEAKAQCPLWNRLKCEKRV